MNELERMFLTSNERDIKNGQVYAMIMGHNELAGAYFEIGSEVFAWPEEAPWHRPINARFKRRYVLCKRGVNYVLKEL